MEFNWAHLNYVQIGKRLSLFQRESKILLATRISDSLGIGLVGPKALAENSDWETIVSFTIFKKQIIECL